MGYLARDEMLPEWVAVSQEVEEAGDPPVQLVGQEGLDQHVPAPFPLGFIIRDWFGPFLLGPPSQFLRGRC